MKFVEKIQNIRRCVRPYWHRAIPSLMFYAAFVACYVLGKAGAQVWWILVPSFFAGFALGAAEDRAETRAKSEWGERFLRLLESDHTIEVSVTAKHEQQQQSARIN